MNKDSAASTPRKSNDPVSMFSPVFVRESPVKKIPQRGNLTGNPRKIRDLAADFYNLIQKWNSCHIKGVEILSKISSLKMTAMEKFAMDDMNAYPEELQSLCDDLEKICEEMSGLVAGMEHCSEQFKAMAVLESYQQSHHKEGLPMDELTPMFLTWSPDRFGKVSSELVERYSSELQVKKKILEGVCYSKTKDVLMFHIAAWAHQPTVLDEDAGNLQLEALLIETGHK